MLQSRTRTNQAAVPGRLAPPRGDYRPILRRGFASRQALPLFILLLPLLVAVRSLSIWNNNSFEFAFPAHWTRNM